MDSILETVKKALGIDIDYTSYDTTIIIHINSIFSILHQMGFGSEELFSITGNTEIWTDFIEDQTNIESIKTYISTQVKLLFDPLKIETGVEVPNSILGTIKKMLGISYDDSSFDTDIIMNINSVFMILEQLGIGPDGGFSILGNTEIWSDYLGDITNLEGIKSYIYLKVKILFDPPTSSAVLDAINRQISEFEWRLNIQVEQGLYTT
jgi:hypothetical protein